MKDPVFLTLHVNYDSYIDFRRLVQVSGFETCHQDHMDLNRDCAYIVTPINGDVEASLRALKERSKDQTKTCSNILWFLERPGPQSKAGFIEDIKQKFETLNLQEIWIGDKDLYMLVKDIAGTRFVPVGSDEAIGNIDSPMIRTDNTEYEITHMSYVWGRRTFIHNMPLRIGPNSWGAERHRILTSSRFMVNVHQDWDQFHEPLRFALCAAYALPMISENCNDPFPYESGVDFVPTPYDKIEETVRRCLIEDYNIYKPIGQHMFETATKKFRFSDNVKAALAGKTW